MGIGAAIAGAAAVGAVGSVASGVIGGNAAKSAADTQATAANDAAATTLQMFNTTQQNLSPYMNVGKSAEYLYAGLLGIPGYETGLDPSLGGVGTLVGGTPGTPGIPASAGTLATQVPDGNFWGATDNFQGFPEMTTVPGTAGSPGMAGSPATGGSPLQPLNLNGLGFGALTRPFAPTMAQLSQTPGYQFTLNQGEQAVTNSNAALGLGSSGAALKGAANYAEGLASTTYQQQFTNYWNQLNNIAGLIGGAAGQGQNAAAGLGGLGNTAAANAGQFTTSAGAAQAAGTVGAANALTSGISGVGSSVSNAALLSSLNSNGLFGGGGQTISAGNAINNSIGGFVGGYPGASY